MERARKRDSVPIPDKLSSACVRDVLITGRGLLTQSMVMLIGLCGDNKASMR
ncbi:hypothetical protein BC629DRAFT_1472129 [Irpex lacteus]|nr:hypothetical protein BC629DRAFT_1525147 [Irpex lacteus]KAI0812321.1 hypothetical protein BC629DRAFT_1472129 [Irpex lacteus]